MNHQDLKPINGEDQLLASPVHTQNIKNYLIDIDGTVTDDVPNEQPERMPHTLPFPDAVQVINQWYDQGHQITFFTSRTEETRSITQDWLIKHGFKHHSLLMHKPRFGNYVIIDNHPFHSIHYQGDWQSIQQEQQHHKK